MMHALRFFVTLAMALTVVSAAATKVVAQVPVGVGVSLHLETVTPKPADPAGGLVAYSAKFLCGTVPHSAVNPQVPPPGFSFVPGTYLTGINIHNRNSSGLEFRKKAVETRPQGQPRGTVGQPVPEGLGPDEGVDVDCGNIKLLLFPAAPPFDPTDPLITGFVVVLVPSDLLDVVGVYTVKNVLPESPPAPAAQPLE